MVKLFEGLSFTIQIIIIIFFSALVIGAVISIIKMVDVIIKTCSRLKEANRLRQSYDVISVEAEITDITTKRWNPMDTQYIVDLTYSVGECTYNKQITLHNKQSLRVGQILILLCDSDDPEKAVLQNGEEEESIKSLTFALIVDIILVILGIIAAYYELKTE